MASLQRINIGQRSIHNPFASQRSKAADPRINALTLARLSYSRNKDVIQACVNNLCDRMESAQIRPSTLPLFDGWVMAVAIACLRTEKMPGTRRSDRIYSRVVNFIEGCDPQLLETIAASTGSDPIMGLIWSSRVPGDLNELSAFSIIAFGNNPYAKLAFDKILRFWPDLKTESLGLFAEKAAKPAVKEAAANELRRRSGVGG